MMTVTFELRPDDSLTAEDLLLLKGQAERMGISFDTFLRGVVMEVVQRCREQRGPQGLPDTTKVVEATKKIRNSLNTAQAGS